MCGCVCGYVGRCVCVCGGRWVCVWGGCVWGCVGVCVCALQWLKNIGRIHSILYWCLILKQLWNSINKRLKPQLHSMRNIYYPRSIHDQLVSSSVGRCFDELRSSVSRSISKSSVFKFWSQQRGCWFIFAKSGFQFPPRFTNVNRGTVFTRYLVNDTCFLVQLCWIFLSDEALIKSLCGIECYWYTVHLIRSP